MPVLPKESLFGPVCFLFVLENGAGMDEAGGWEVGVYVCVWGGTWGRSSSRHRAELQRWPSWRQQETTVQRFTPTWPPSPPAQVSPRDDVCVSLSGIFFLLIPCFMCGFMETSLSRQETTESNFQTGNEWNFALISNFSWFQDTFLINFSTATF